MANRGGGDPALPATEQPPGLPAQPTPPGVSDQVTTRPPVREGLESNRGVAPATTGSSAALQAAAPPSSLYVQNLKTPQGTLTVQYGSVLSKQGNTTIGPLQILKNVTFQQPFTQTIGTSQIQANVNYTYGITGGQIVASPTGIASITGQAIVPQYGLVGGNNQYVVPVVE